MKNSKSYIKLGIAMLLGALIGTAGSIAAVFWGGDMRHLAEGVSEHFAGVGVLAEVVLAVVSIVVAAGIFAYLRSLWRKEERAEDEAADAYGAKFERWAQIGLLLTESMAGVLLVLGCCAFPVGFSPYGREGVLVLLLMTAMVLGTGFMAVMQIAIYHLMQKRDPQKKGDPSSLSFNKRWLESCDETEKLVIYQAGYKAFSWMQAGLLVAIILALFGENHFGTGKFPIVLVGSLWILGVAVFGVWRIKGLNSGRKSREK